MNLHLKKEEFKNAINLCSKSLNIPPAFVEKDYYVTYFLNELIKIDDNYIFKGGTCLFKAYKIIDRFSEDIDLSYPLILLTVGKRGNIKKDILEVGSKIGKITNLEDTRSRRSFNRYIFEYQKTFLDERLKQDLIVEAAFQSDSYPTEENYIESLITTYLKNNNYYYAIKIFEIDGFKLKTQKLERTFVDKLFAICDYHISKKLDRQSRHIYDLYKIYPFIKLDSNFVDLFNNVRKDRQNNVTCYSAFDGMEITSLIDELIKEDTFKEDYLKNGYALEWNPIEYEVIINGLKEINEELKKIIK